MTKVAIVYSSLTGNTKKVAEALHSLDSEHYSLFSVSDNPDLDDFDVIAVGYWVDRGGPSEEAKQFMKKISGKKVFLFQTLGAEPMGTHAMTSAANGGAALGSDCHVLEVFSCQGAIDPKLIEMMKKMPPGVPHAPTPENLERWAKAASHPDAQDIEMAKQSFTQMLERYERFYAHGAKKD